MAKERGKTCILKVGDGASSEAFVTLPGQRVTTFSDTTDTADVTTKDSSGFKEHIALDRQITVTAQGVVNWPADPDVGPLADLRAAKEGGTTVNCQLILNTAGDKHAGAFYVTQLDTSADNNDATQYSVTLLSSGAVTFSAGN